MILSYKVEGHIKHVNVVLRMLENAGASVKIRKSQFFRKRLDYLGNVLLFGRIDIAKDSTSTITDTKFW